MDNEHKCFECNEDMEFAGNEWDGSIYCELYYCQSCYEKAKAKQFGVKESEPCLIG